MAVKFTFDPDKTAAALLYLATRLPKMDKYIACKMLFLADKQHLVKYGRPITGDSYAAMDHGPVPSNTLTLLNGLENGQDNPLARMFDLNRVYRYPRLVPKGEPDMELLSRSNTQSLDEVADAHGRKSFAELKALTHELAAYKKAWARPRHGDSAPMDFEDFFSEDEDAIAGAFEEMLENDELRKAFPEPVEFQSR
jgi:uncharacterized phage-associated protein